MRADDWVQAARRSSPAWGPKAAWLRRLVFHARDDGGRCCEQHGEEREADLGGEEPGRAGIERKAAVAERVDERDRSEQASAAEKEMAGAACGCRRGEGVDQADRPGGEEGGVLPRGAGVEGGRQQLVGEEDRATANGRPAQAPAVVFARRRSKRAGAAARRRSSQSRLPARIPKATRKARTA